MANIFSYWVDLRNLQMQQIEKLFMSCQYCIIINDFVWWYDKNDKNLADDAGCYCG